MKKYAVIVAGGIGARMNSAIPKQFMFIKDKPVLFYTLDTFLKAFDDMQVILVLPEDHIAIGQEIIDGFFDDRKIQIITGGRTRFHSVQNGLSLVEDESIIFVHDGVRCLVTVDLIRRAYEAAIEFGTAIPCVASKNSVRVITDDTNRAINREQVMLIQTPQTFHSKILLPAYKIDYKDKYTDEASVVEAYGLKVHLIEGEENNIKITTPLDMILAENLLK
jgi:2-C-methyl-D-erythritol 4-phosphate cytidylyltransferase